MTSCASVATINLIFKHSFSQNSESSRFDFNVDLELPSTGLTAIYGHSGCGKTTLLRCIAGLNTPEKGRVRFREQIWQSEQICLPANKRPIGYVFQEASLFDFLTAKQNLEFAIKRADTRHTKLDYKSIIDVLGIEHILCKYPSQLSGGEKQRVAIARALLIQPSLLLMDEPLASLDPARKQEILPYLKALKHAFNTPILYVTHSLQEVAQLADHLVIMAKGKAVASGQVTELFSQLDLPLQLEQDSSAILEGVITEKDEKWHLMKFQFQGGALWLKDCGQALNSQVRVSIQARDVSITLAEHQDSSIVNRLAVTVVDIAKNIDPSMALVRLQTGDSYLLARLTLRSVDQLKLQIGQSIWAQIKSAALLS
ncbi:molybdenum ABC transporter ATP-binding protein [Saccharobesus litoralis]|uniref:Molybdenum ABC transporter ATP-binding protein n=1 Tax=Saccharobesus litoralis TaxID=2172099 RepID=A0A2S0VLS3_9ALTE|nr:molybdenum ABC transporter ATP-binding protein [Saccharobesus litoralis]AWB65164.1 molybdenum ABC transporter ATP-binding protein [Saccharobesus litoralis]